MNMISNGSFLTETGASNKQSELVKKLTAAWEKKNSKTARAGGASLMALSLAACGGEDNTPFSKADVDAAKAEGVASVDITSDNTDVMLAQADYDAAIEAAKTSNDADIAAAAKTEALTSADGTIYATVDAAYTAGSNLSNADAVTAALTGADGTVYATVDAAVTAGADGVDITTDNQAAIDAEMAGTGFVDVASLLAAYNDAIAATPAVSTALTTATNDAVQGTSNDDTVTGTATTYQTGDIITDAQSSDNDTLNITLTAANSGQPTVIGFENINFNVTSFAAIDVDADGIRGGTITVNQLQAGASGDATVDDVVGASGTIVTAGTGITGTLTVNADSGGLTVNGGTATTIAVTTANAGTNSATTINGTAATQFDVDGIDLDGTTITSAKAGTSASQIAFNLDGSTAATDSVTMSVNGFADVDGEVTAGDDVEIYDLSGNGAAATYTFNGDETIEQITFSGSQDVTVVGDAAQFTGEKFIDNNSGTTTVSVTTAGVLDIDTDAAIDVLNLGVNMAGNQIDIASGQTINVAVSDAVGLDVNAAAATAASNSLALTVNDNTSTTSTINFGTVDITNIKTVSIALTDNLTSSAGSYGATTAVTLTGAGDATFGGTAGSLTATGMTGALTATLSANLKTVTGGEGDDTFNGYAGDMTIDGGAGSNTLAFAATTDMSTKSVSLTNIDIIQLDSAAAGTETVSLKGSALDGITTVVKGTGAANDTLAIVMDETSFAGGGITVDTSTAVVSFDMTGVATLATTITGTTGVDSVANEGTGAVTMYAGAGDDTVDVSGGSAAHKVYGQDGGDTLTGGAGAETLDGGAGDDTIIGGDGANTLTAGEGSDFVVGGADVDTVDLSETSSKIDYFNYTAQGEGSAAGVANGSFSNYDVVTGFTAGKDLIRFDSNVSDTTADIDALALAVNGKFVFAQTAATNSALDLADADFTDVDKVVSFLGDAHTNTDSVGEVVAITFSDFSAVYFIDTVTADGAIAAGEVELLGTFDAILTTTELVIA